MGDSSDHQRALYEAPQASRRVLMIQPAAFGVSADCHDNSFIARDPVGSLARDEQARARQEWYALATALRSKGVEVVTFDNPDPVCRDAHFPNNWFSTHRGSSSLACLYPMAAPSRRRERLPAVVHYLEDQYKRILDFSAAEKLKPALALEGTGSLVLDRVHRQAYMALSQRSDLRLAQQWAEESGHGLFAFATSRPQPIYHTNVMMAIGSRYAVVCLDAIEDPRERQELSQRLSLTHRLIAITGPQLAAFCGNILELVGGDGKRLLAMSASAAAHFTPAQKAELLGYVDELLVVDIATIEAIGGGSVRCMLAELF